MRLIVAASYANSPQMVGFHRGNLTVAKVSIVSLQLHIPVDSLVPDAVGAEDQKKRPAKTPLCLAPKLPEIG
jgi:hypothetical protein